MKTLKEAAGLAVVTAMLLIVLFSAAWCASRGWYMATPSAAEPIKVLVQYR